MNQAQLLLIATLAIVGGIVIIVFFIQMISIRSGVKNKFLAYFLEKDRRLSIETVKIRTEKTGQFFNDSKNGTYRIDHERIFVTDWPKSAPSWMRVPIQAAWFVRNEPEATAIPREPSDLRKHTPQSAMTSQMIHSLSNENVLRLLIEKAEKQVGAVKRNEFLTTVLAGLSVVAVIGLGIYYYQTHKVDQQSLEEMRANIQVVKQAIGVQ